MGAQTTEISRPRPGIRSAAWPLRIGWVLLLILGAFYVFAPIADIASDHSSGLPADHHAAFQKLAGVSWTAAQSSAPGVAKYVTQLEYGYALHELTFAVLFLAIVAIPFRRRQAWAWWACWAVMIANIGYAVTIAHYAPALLRQSLIGVIVLPVALLISAPYMLRKSKLPETPQE
jgi:hypothetical protein